MLPLFLVVSIALTIINTFSDLCVDFIVRLRTSGTLGVGLISRYSGLFGSSMPLYCSTSDSLFASQSYSLLFGLSKSPFQLSQFLVLEMVSGALSSPLSAGSWSNIFIQWTLNTCVCSPGRFIADQACGKGEISGN